jgi:UDP-2,3-diacylglucosamine hydrolase
LSAHYFISDAHLGAGRREAESRLFSFLESIRGHADSLYILGDLFEFWFEYRWAVPKHGFKALARLAELHDRGTRIGYLKGNHDFWFKNFLKREMDADAADEMDVVIDGKRVFLCHGDVLDKGFVPRLFRSLMRSPVSGALYGLGHPDFGIGLAQRVALTSRAMTAKPYLLKAMSLFAERQLASGFDIVVMGHSHVPELTAYGKGMYLNVGDWIQHFTYGIIRDGVPALEVFEG